MPLPAVHGRAGGALLRGVQEVREPVPEGQEEEAMNHRMNDNDFTLPSILMPWETFRDQAEREAREHESGERWTKEFLCEVEEKIREYENDIDAPGWCERVAAISLLNDVYRQVPYHFRSKLFSAKAMGVINHR